MNFSGIDDPYEIPEHPELTLDTRALSVEQCVARVLERLGGGQQ
jgi:adenylylsulfate kinase-like enzyme